MIKYDYVRNFDKDLSYTPFKVPSKFLISSKCNDKKLSQLKQQNFSETTISHDVIIISLLLWIVSHQLFN